jgi:hypothetical protein
VLVARLESPAQTASQAAPSQHDSWRNKPSYEIRSQPRVITIASELPPSSTTGNFLNRHAAMN